MLSPKSNAVPKQTREEYQYFQIYEGDSSEGEEGDTAALIPPPSRLEKRRNLPKIMIGSFLMLCVLGTVGTLAFYYKPDNNFHSKEYEPSVLGNFSKAAVSVDGEPCAKIGTDVLREGGTAVDATIAALFCNGVYNSQSMGLGGGFLMTIYIKDSNTGYTLDAREKAPLAATEDMFEGDSSASQRGPLSVAVPGEVHGYWQAKTRFGNPAISWSRLVKPTVDMCRTTGIHVSWTHAKTLRDNELTDPKMREVFINPETDRPWVEGDVYYRPVFADTLEKLAEAGDRGEESLGFYKGEVGKDLVHDLKEMGGIITEEDFLQYTADWVDPVQVTLKNKGMTLYSVPPPGSGAIMAYILNILDLYNIQPADNIPLLYHRITEAFKWAYALRTELGDPSDPEITDFVNQLVANMSSESWASDRWNKIDDDVTSNNASHYGAVFYTPNDHGTAHVSVLAENGDAVSTTSTINLYFGSLLMSGRTGIIYNDEMDDFSAPNITNYFGVPPSPHNFIKGGKRPLSSMSPGILVDEAGNVRLVVGAAGGTKITTATAMTIIRNLWLNQDIKQSIDARRIHHQLAPMQVSYEPEFPQNILTDLESKGHVVELVDAFGSVVNGIAVENGRVYANADFRKAGGVDGY